MVNLALIGVGNWGKNYVATCKKLPNVRLKYLCAASEKNLKNYHGDYIKTTHYKELFDYSDIDGIIIATPNATHNEISAEFLKKGYNILLEKPMSENYRKALTLLPLQKKGGQLNVGYIYLFDPAYIKTKEIVNKMGKIRYIDYEGTSYGLLRKKTSVLWDIGSHAISLSLDIAQKNPKMIRAWANNLLYPKSKFYDAASLKLDFEDGTFAYIRLNWLFPEKRRKFVITGENDSVMYDAEADKKVVFYKNIIPDKDLYIRYNGARVSYPTYDSTTPLENEIMEFVKAIRKKQAIIYSDLDLGIKVTKVLNLAERSIAQNGKPMNFSEK